MGKSSTLLALSEGNPLVTSGFPSQRTSNVVLVRWSYWAFYANRPVTGLFQNGYFFNPECCKDWHFRDYHRIKKSRHGQWKIAFISHCVILWNWARVNSRYNSNVEIRQNVHNWNDCKTVLYTMEIGPLCFFFNVKVHSYGPISIVYNTVEVGDLKCWNGWKCKSKTLGNSIIYYGNRPLSLCFCIEKQWKRAFFYSINILWK